MPVLGEDSILIILSDLQALSPLSVSTLLSQSYLCTLYRIHCLPLYALSVPAISVSPSACAPMLLFQRMHLRSLPALLSASAHTIPVHLYSSVPTFFLSASGAAFLLAISAPTLLLSVSAPTLLLSDSVVCTQITLLCVCTHITPLCLCSQVTPVCLCTHVTPVCLCGLFPRYFASVSVVLYPRHFYNLTNVLSYAPSYGHIGTLNRGVGMGPQGFMNPGHGTLGRAGKPPSQPTYST